jgi:hypothetical protein
MAQDTLILLCKNLNDAIMSTSKLERRYDLNRLYIFLGKKPANNELSWMSNTDNCFCLERAIEWSDSAELIGVRAGLMFATGWDLLFCWADNCPDTKDIDWVINNLKTDGTAKLSNVWGISRDHYILHGLGESTQQFFAEPKQNNILNGLSIADALEGKSVNSVTAVQALHEIVAISPLAVHESIVGTKDKLTQAIIDSADYIDDIAPVSIIVGDCAEDVAVALRQKIAKHGVLIQVSQSLPEYDFKPYRTIFTTDGINIALYGK